MREGSSYNGPWQTHRGLMGSTGLQTFRPADLGEPFHSGGIGRPVFQISISLRAFSSPWFDQILLIMESNPEYKIVKAQPNHSKEIADFQILMAKETEDLALNEEIVVKAVDFLQQNPEYGFFLVKVKGQLPVGSLMMTFENKAEWWIQSVYVTPDQRRKGHFTSLFHESVRLAKESQATHIKLYVETKNDKARNTYLKLGMFVNPEKYYVYDLIYGHAKAEDFNLASQSNVAKAQPEEQSVYVKQFTNVLQTENNGRNKCLKYSEGEDVKGFCSYFYEFSEWRFGLTIYIDTLMTKSSQPADIGNISMAFLSYLHKNSPVKVGALRIIFRESAKTITEVLKGGEVEHYDVMELVL